MRRDTATGLNGIGLIPETKKAHKLLDGKIKEFPFAASLFNKE